MREVEPASRDISLEAPARDRYRAERVAHRDEVACDSDRWQGLGGAYHRRLAEIYRALIPPGGHVLEIGCGRGDLLSSLAPAGGVGVDFSGEMIRRARERHAELRFVECDAAEVGRLSESFEFIILSDLINDLWDVQEVLDQIRMISTPKTRVILNSYSRLWGLPLALARSLGLANRNLAQN